MRLWPGHPRYLVKLTSLLRASEAGRSERLIATARVILAVSGLVAVYLDPTQPSRFAALAYSLLLVYAVHCGAVVVFLKLSKHPHPSVGLMLHGIDLVFSCSITFFTEGPSSPFFAFFVFLLVAAAYRGGFPQTVLTALISIALLFVQAFVVTVPVDSLAAFVDTELELNRLVMRAAYLALVGFLVGYLAEAEKRLRAETDFVSRLLRRARAEIHFQGTLQFLFREFLELFEAENVMLVTTEGRSERTFVWEAQRSREGAEIELESRELDSEERSTYLFPFTANSWVAKRGNREKQVQLLGIDGNGALVKSLGSALPSVFLERRDFRHLAVVEYSANTAWSSRLFLFEPRLDGGDKEALGFLQNVVNQIAPAVYNVYLLRRLRSQAGAIERARVARELHDGVIQVLISAEMQIEALRRRAGEGTAGLRDDLVRLQELLRQTVIQVRELVQQVKPLEIEPSEFLDFLASTVDKFGRDTGIAARFHSELDEVRLRPRVAHELARIVQEALVNVRKHSRARNVLVRFGAEDGLWKLVVDDDGIGFDFSGRVSSLDPETARRGPIIIKERVRSLGGEVSVESSPGKGSRLEITFPRETGTTP